MRCTRLNVQNARQYHDNAVETSRKSRVWVLFTEILDVARCLRPFAGSVVAVVSHVALAAGAKSASEVRVKVVKVVVVVVMKLRGMAAAATTTTAGDADACCALNARGNAKDGSSYLSPAPSPFSRSLSEKLTRGAAILSCSDVQVNGCRR